jgi:chitinase
MAAVLLATTAFAGTAAAGPDHGRRIPAHVFAPYFQGYLNDDPAELAAASGAEYLNMSFLHTDKPGSCDVFWNGVPETPVAQSSYGDAIAKIRARGGDVIPALGGGYAGGNGTELADSCTDVDAIAATFEKVVTTYNVTRLDLDVEGGSLDKGLDRRNKAIRKVQQWAAGQGRVVEFVYTLGTSPKGLIQDGVDILENAIENGAEVRMVNLMTFDYYDNKQHDMFADTRTAAEGTVKILRELYPHKTSAQLWNMIGITEMIGLDDYGSGGETGPLEVFSPTDAIATTIWAYARGIGQLSFWALARDNGNCPGQHIEDCSGVRQAEWQYTRTMKLFTHR